MPFTGLFLHGNVALRHLSIIYPLYILTLITELALNQMYFRFDFSLGLSLFLFILLFIVLLPNDNRLCLDRLLNDIGRLPFARKTWSVLLLSLAFNELFIIVLFIGVRNTGCWLSSKLRCLDIKVYSFEYIVLWIFALFYFNVLESKIFVLFQL